MNTRFSATKRGKRRGAPNTVNGTVPPRRLLNAKRRPREYLTVKEVGKLVEGARSRGRYGHRDATMILIAYRHGLRASELCALRWDQVDLERGLVHVRRLEERNAERASDGRQRNSRAAASEARANRIAIRLRYRAPGTDDGRPAFARCWREQGRQGSFRSRCIRTCCAMRAGTSLPMTGRTRARCSTTSGTRISSTRCATPSCRRSGSNRFGRIEGRAGARGLDGGCITDSRSGRPALGFTELLRRRWSRLVLSVTVS